MVNDDILAFKRGQLASMAEQRDSLRRAPRLTWLFFELTNICNLRCAHCGSSCLGTGTQLSAEDAEAVLDDVLENLPESPSIAVTGGEPLLHPDLYRIGSAIADRGLGWGMTTNATLIGRDAARSLRKARMSTVSVSLDGLESSHDRLRHRQGAWRKALDGIRCLQEEGFHPQVTTVVHRGNFSELDELHELLLKLRIDSWRIINMEPIGRALEHEDMLLSPARYTAMLAYIREKRFDPSAGMEVTFGCSHYLGAASELMVRDHYFMCGAGIMVASIRCNGDICACLDIENRPELIQGNIRCQRFTDVWKSGFGAFRRDRTEDCEKCRLCDERFVCGGDSAHTWDFGKGCPLFCVKDMLPDPLPPLV